MSSKSTRYVVTVSKTFEVTKEAKILIDVPNNEAEGYAEDLALELCDPNRAKTSQSKILEEFEDEEGRVTVDGMPQTAQRIEWKLVKDTEADETATVNIVAVRKFRASKQK